jgi:hypothetical protein
MLCTCTASTILLQLTAAVYTIAIKATGIQTCHYLYEPYPYSVQEIPSSPPLQNNIYSPFSIFIDLSQLQTVPLPFDCPAILFVDDPSRD